MGGDEEGTLAALTAHLGELIEPCIDEHRGRVVKTTGDGLLAEFASVVDAVRAAVACQDGMRERNADTPEARRIVFRIEVNLGDVIVQGDGVNVAARLEGLAEPGGIVVSGLVHEAVRAKLDCGFDDLGPQAVKNIAEPVRAFRVRAAVAQATEALALADKPSIAVLPFENMSGDPKQEYFADGITEDIITTLSRLREFFVITRNSVFTYKGRSVDVATVGRELGVRYVLEGSTRKVGNRVRITAQLIDALSSGHLWAERVDREIADIFEVQDEITQKIVNTVAPEILLAEAERLKARPQHDLDAWALCHRAYAHYWRWTKNDLEKAAELARQGMEVEPSNADCAALLACALWGMAISGYVRPAEPYLSEAYDQARKGVALDDRSARAHSIMATVLTARRHYREAIREAERAMEQEPGSAPVLLLAGGVNVYSGQLDLGLAHLREAVRLNPRDPQLYGCHLYTAAASFALALYEEAADASARVIRMAPEHPEGYALHIASLAQLGRTDEVEIDKEELLRIQPHYSLAYAKRRHPFHDTEVLDRLLEALHKAGLPE